MPITSFEYNADDVEEGRRRLERAHAHVGRLTTMCARIEDFATIILARTVAPADCSIALTVFNDASWSMLSRNLRAALAPESDQAPAARFLAAINGVERDRNRLAHTQILNSWGITEKSSTTRLIGRKTGWAEVDEAEFDATEARAAVVFEVAQYLARNQDPNFHAHDLFNIATRIFAGGPSGELAAAHALFGPLLTKKAPRVRKSN